MRVTLIVFAIICCFLSCKKENKTTAASPPSYTGGGNALTLYSYPNSIGNSWVYAFNSKEVISNNNGVTTNTLSYNYTVTVIADTIMPNNNIGKIWSLTFQNPLSNRKLVAYIDSTSGLFKIEQIDSPFSMYFYVTLNYPLTLNKTWENTGQTPLDTSTVTSQESNKLVIDRGYWDINGIYKYKINNKGIIYSLYSRYDIVGNQITMVNYESTLLSTNF